MSNIIPMNYDDRSFPFASDCWFNATVAAKHHGRKVTEWLRLPSTKEYMAELCQELGIEGFNFKGGIFPPLVRIEKGRYGGTASSGVGGGIRPLVVSKIRPRL